MNEPTHCYDCAHCTVKVLGDGSTQYGCAVTPGLVTAISSAFDDEEPEACRFWVRQIFRGFIQGNAT